VFALERPDIGAGFKAALKKIIAEMGGL